MDKILGKEEKREKGIRGKHGKNGIHKERGTQIRGGKREIKTAQRERLREETHTEMLLSRLTRNSRDIFWAEERFSQMCSSYKKWMKPFCIYDKMRAYRTKQPTNPKMCLLFRKKQFRMNPTISNQCLLRTLNAIGLDNLQSVLWRHWSPPSISSFAFIQPRS